MDEESIALGLEFSILVHFPALPPPTHTFLSVRSFLFAGEQFVGLVASV